MVSLLMSAGLPFECILHGREPPPEVVDKN